MLLLLSIVKFMSELLALALLGQGVLWVLAGAARETNFVYRMFAAITKPIMRLARLLMPRFVMDRHIWMAALGLVLIFWIVAWTQLLEACLGSFRDDPQCADLVLRKVELCARQSSSDPLCTELIQVVKQKAGQTK